MPPGGAAHVWDGGVCQPGPLKDEARGGWSWRITDEHRLVHLLGGDDLIVLPSRYRHWSVRREPAASLEDTGVRPEHRDWYRGGSGRVRDRCRPPVVECDEDAPLFRRAMNGVSAVPQGVSGIDVIEGWR